MELSSTFMRSSSEFFRGKIVAEIPGNSYLKIMEHNEVFKDEITAN